MAQIEQAVKLAILLVPKISSTIFETLTWKKTTCGTSIRVIMCHLFGL